MATYYSYTWVDGSVITFPTIIPNGNVIQKSADTYVIKSGSFFYQYNGFGFTYNVSTSQPSTQISGGIISSISVSDIYSTQIFSASSLNIDPLTLYYASLTDEPSANLASGSSSYRYIMSGNDVFYGSSVGETLRGAGGDDWLYGSDGPDVLFGDDGNDYLFGDFGDTVGGSRGDRMFGGAGNDIILGGVGNDTASGGDGNEWIFGGQGEDSLSGDNGDDVVVGDIVGESGRDLLNGGYGGDILIGGDGDDRLYGMSQYSTYAESANDGFNWIFGGHGGDALYGGGASDVIYGDLFEGEVGQDGLYGGGGNDTLIGGPGRDILYGEAEGDWLYGQAGADTISGGVGSDLFWFQSSGDAGDEILDFSFSEGDRLVVYPVHVNAGYNVTTQQAFDAGLYGFSRIDVTTSSLWFDADGAGPGARITLATLQWVQIGSTSSSMLM